MIKKNTLAIVLAFYINACFSQEFNYSVGVNACRVKYDFTYLKETNSYVNPEMVSDTFNLRKLTVGPSFRTWYSHEFGESLKLITGIEGTVGLIPGNGSLTNGFFIDLPIFVGGEYDINNRISVFSTIGGSYDFLVGYYEIHSVFGNIEFGTSFDLDGDFLIFKLRFGKLLYQPYSDYFPFQEKDVTKYRAGILNVGLSYLFKSTN